MLIPAPLALWHDAPAVACGVAFGSNTRRGRGRRPVSRSCWDRSTGRSAVRVPIHPGQPGATTELPGSSLGGMHSPDACECRADADERI